MEGIKEKMQTWNKNPKETSRAYNAFLIYKNLGALRSLRKTAEVFYGAAYFSKYLAKEQQIFRWSSKYNWVARCLDWDIEEERIQIEEKRKDIAEMDRRQAKDGMEMSKIGMYNIKLQATDDPPKDKHGKIIKPKIPVPESTRLFTEGTKAERLARGEVTEISGHKGELNIKVIEVDDEIAKKALDEIAKRKINDTGSTGTED